MFGSKNKDKLQQALQEREKVLGEVKTEPPENLNDRQVFKFLNAVEDKDNSNIPRVYSKKNRDVPEDAVYVGRDSPYGNPYTVLTDGGREQAIKKYADYLFRTPDLLAKVIKDLKGKNLVCHCTPLPCHADVLLLVANPELDFNNKFTDYQPDDVSIPKTNAFKMK